MGHHLGVEDNADLVSGVVDQRERRHRARIDAENLLEPLRARERQLGRADLAAQDLQVDFPILQRHHQPVPALFVLQEKVLAMRAGKVAAKRFAFVDGEDRRVPDGAGFDAKFGQTVEEIAFCCGHAGRFICKLAASQYFGNDWRR